MSGNSKNQSQRKTILVDLDVTLKLDVPVNFNQDDINDVVDEMEVLIPLKTDTKLIEVEIGEATMKEDSSQ